MSRRWGLLPQATLPVRLETALAFVLLGYTLPNDQSYELYHRASGLPYKAVADVSHWLHSVTGCKWISRKNATAY